MKDQTMQTLKASVMTGLAVATAVCAVGTILDGTIPLWVTAVFSCLTLICACLCQEERRDPPA